MTLPSLQAKDSWLIALSGFVLALVLALTLTLFGWFHPALTIIAGVFLFGGLSLALVPLYREQDTLRLGLIGVLALFALLLAFQTEPTVFTGRDQGSIALASLELAKNHELAFRTAASDAFFGVYGPGRALNFPGFSYTDTGALITQFPLGYIAYLGLFVSWFGLSGLLIANGTLFVLSSWTFFELCSLFVSRRNAVLGTVLFATSFLTLWLSQITLTENLALFLFLALMTALVRADRNNDPRFLPVILTTSFLLALTRIEGFVIAPIAIGILLLRPTLRAHLFALPKKWAIPALLFFGFLFLRDLFMNLPFYTMIAKAALKYWHEVSSTPGDEPEPNLGGILFSYGLFPIFILGIAGVVFEFMKRRLTLLIPFLLVLPTFIYLINGHISDDHPWLLRRYAFTLFPFFLLVTVALSDTWEKTLSESKKKFAGPLVFSLLLVCQLWPAYQAFSVIEYQTLRQQALNFGTQFSANDLILIDRGSTGDPFAMISGPLGTLAGKNAVYFFNPEDYTRLDRSAFEHVYLLTTEDSLARYTEVLGNNLLPVEVISFSFPRLAAPAAFAWPVAGTVNSDAILFEITQ